MAIIENISLKCEIIRFATFFFCFVLCIRLFLRSYGMIHQGYKKLETAVDYRQYEPNLKFSVSSQERNCVSENHVR